MCSKPSVMERSVLYLYMPVIVTNITLSIWRYYLRNWSWWPPMEQSEL